MKKRLYKKLILSVVALILVSTMVVGVTYSWIESITAVEISNSGAASGGDTSNLKLGGDIAETINIKNCGPEGSVIGKNGTTATNWADLGAYFNDSGDMHLTTCSGNGDSFMFRNLKGSSDANPWRIGTEDDENVNYISATFRINVSNEADVDFWFKQIPTVKKGTTELDIAYYSFTVDGETKVYSKNGGTYTHISNANGGTTNVTAEPTAKYTFGHKTNVNPNDINDINTNVLFSIPKGTTKDVTVRIWLQDTNNSDTYTGEKVNVDMQIVSTWAVTRRIRIFDGTSDYNKEHWVYNDNARMFLALSADTSKHWELDIDTQTHYGYADIPSYYYEGNEICIYRCDPNNGDKDGFNSGNITYNGVKCWNYWATKLPKGFKNETFNILGNTPYYDKKQSDIGYIYWGEVEHITITDTIGLNHSEDEKRRMIVHDADTGFYYALKSTDSGQFSGYIPKSSDKIEFRYKDGGFELNRINSINNASETDSNKKNNCYSRESCDKRWGYNKDEKNPQKRPLGATNYIILSDTEGMWDNLVDSGYRLTNDFNGTKLYVDPNDSNKAFAYYTLEENKLYEFRIKNKAENDTDDIYYSNDGVMCYSESNNYPMTTEKNSTNLGLISLGAGTYKFELNLTNREISVTYPQADNQGGRLYLVVKSGFNGLKKYAKFYKNNAFQYEKEMTWYKSINSWDIYWADYSGDSDRVDFATNEGNEHNNHVIKEEVLFPRYYIP